MEENKEQGTVVELLMEIRDLLIPISHAYADEYEEAMRRDRVLQEKQSILDGLGSTAARRRVFELLFDEERLTQADIARYVGISQPAVSQFVSALYDNDLVDSYTNDRGEVRARNKYDIWPK
jgi:DNA-binding transcriptional ArsR family regulator